MFQAKYVWVTTVPEIYSKGSKLKNCKHVKLALECIRITESNNCKKNVIFHYTFSPHYGHRIVVLKGSVKIGVHCNTNKHTRKSGVTILKYYGLHWII